MFTWALDFPPPPYLWPSYSNQTIILLFSLPATSNPSPGPIASPDYIAKLPSLLRHCCHLVTSGLGCGISSSQIPAGPLPLPTLLFFTQQQVPVFQLTTLFISFTAGSTVCHDLAYLFLDWLTVFFPLQNPSFKRAVALLYCFVFTNVPPWCLACSGYHMGEGMEEGGWCWKHPWKWHIRNIKRDCLELTCTHCYI